MSTTLDLEIAGTAVNVLCGLGPQGPAGPPGPPGSGGAGTGDMLKSVYDTNNNGIVDTADSLAWSKLTGVPAVFPPDTTAELVVHKGQINGYAGLDATGKVPVAQLPPFGTGDMTKAVYDTNANGVVDTCDSLAWTKLTGVPASFTPSAHAPTHLDNGADPIPLATTLRTGLMPKLTGTTSVFLDGTGNFSSPPVGGGGGDMLKATYDTNNNGVVDTADSLAWTKLTGVPATFTPAVHGSTHIGGGTDAIPVATTTVAGLMPAKPNAGVNATTTQGVMGDDTRLTNARTPTAHATTHESGGSDAIPLDTLAAPTDITTLNASTTAHGLLPKLPGGTTTFLRADGTFAAPAGGGDMLKSVYDTNANNVVDTCDSLAWSKLTGVPATFTPSAHETTHITGGSDIIPTATSAASGLVPVTPNNAAQFLAGGATATFAALPANTTAQAGTVAAAPNDGNKVYLGTAQWGLLPLSTETTAAFTIPAAGATVTIAITSVAWGAVGQTFRITDGTNIIFAELTTRTSNTSWVVTNRNYQGNAVSGTMATAALVTLACPGLATATQAGFVPTPPNDTTKALLGNGAFGTLLYSSLGSIPANFTPAPHETTHITGGSDIIPAPTTAASGLVPPLPTTNATKNFLRGDATFAQANYPDLTNIPASFTPSAHATTHAGGGSDPIALAATTASGTVPALVAAGTGVTQQQRSWARGDNSWQSLPLQSFSGFIETPSVKVYTIDLSVAPALGYRIVQFSAVLTGGTATVSINRNGTAITGGSALSLSTTLSNTTLSVDTAQNDKIDLNVTAVSSPANLAFSLRYQA